MSTSSTCLPSSWREWERVVAPTAIRVLASDSGDARFGLLECPRLVPGRTTPRFSLVLMLSRPPGGQDEAIRPLLRSSYLGMEVTCALPADAQQSLKMRPLFVRQMDMALRTGPSATAILAKATSQPALLRGELHTHLGLEDTLAVLDAIDGRIGRLALHTRVAFMASASGDTGGEGDEGGLLASGSTRMAVTWRTGALRELEWTVPLHEVLGHALSAAEREACLRVVGPSLDLEGPGTQLLKGGTTRGTREGIGRGAVLAGARIQSVAAALQPSAQPRPSAQWVATQAVRLPTSGVQAAVTHLALPHVWYEDPSQAAVSLPVVGDLAGPWLEDRQDASVRWYLPQARLVSPLPTQSPDASPFLFDLYKTGTLPSGQPALRAQIRFTVAWAPSEATSAAMAAHPGLKFRMIEPVAPSACLTVPYIDAATGELRRASYVGTLTAEGNRWVVTIEVVNDAARLAYGSLSTPDFQREASQLEVSFQFAHFQRVPNRPVLDFGGKIAHAVFVERKRGDDPGISVTVGGRELRLQASLARPAALNLGLSGRITTSDAAIALPARMAYARRTTVRRCALDAFWSCAQWGAFYRERIQTQSVAMGCVDSYRLGQAPSRRYQEMTEMRDTTLRVWRDLQQPGRFMVQPLTYAVTRHAASDPERAYRPAAIVYASLDAEHPERSRIRFEAMLAPAIGPHAWRDLRRRLAEQAANPVLDLPNAIAHDTEVQWSLTATPPVDVHTTCTPDGLHAALATDLSSALLLKTVIENTGLAGSVRFAFDDGSVLSSALSLHLGLITGPWPEGPIQTRRTAGGLQLVNRIEGALALHDLHAYSGTGEVTVVSLDTTLAPAASMDVAVDAALADAAVSFVAASGARPSFEEVRAMIEDIQCNVVFVDLIHHESHALLRLDVEARLRGVPGTSAVPMADRRGSVDFLLPLTTYLAARILEFRVVKTFDGRAAETTDWIAWDLEAQSNVVSLSWDLLAP